MQPIRVFVVDDQLMCRQGLAGMVAADAALAWVGDACDDSDALDKAVLADPDVLVLDMEIPGRDAVAMMQRLRQRLPRVRWLLVSAHLDPGCVRDVLAAGATGVLMKTASAAELSAAVQAVHRGERVCAPAIEAALAEGEAGAHLGAELTRRERELLNLMALGLGNDEISLRMDIAVPTVKFHITNILSKMGASNRTAAVLTALRHRLVVLNEAQA